MQHSRINHYEVNFANKLLDHAFKLETAFLLAEQTAVLVVDITRV
jgi:hypothetical protein